MAKHNVYVNLPSRELGKADAIFDIYRDGDKHGTITISKGGLEWYPHKAKQPYKLGWEGFDRMVKKFFDE